MVGDSGYNCRVGVIEVAGAAYAHPGGAELFDDVTFRVGTGHHVAMVGANGVGKSTLLRCIAGDLRLADGFVRTDASSAYMPQAVGTGGDSGTVQDLLVRFSPPPVRAAAAALAEAERANDVAPSPATGGALASAVIAWAEAHGYEHERRWDEVCRRVLKQPLSIACGRPTDQLSGGERKRLVQELLLAGDASILLLDEPDNFLDVPGKRWLERELAASSKTVLLVSHDRELLTAVADTIVTVEGSGCWTHAGSYGTYTEARDARNERLGDAVERWRAEERRLFAHFKIMKQRAALSDANARKADAAETRWRRFADAGPPPAPPSTHDVRVGLTGSTTGKRALRCRSLAIAGLTDPFDLEVFLGERVAVLGANGVGKSHLLRLLAGEPIEHEGEWILGARVDPGFFHQTDEVAEFAGWTPLGVLAGRDLAEEPAMRALARYGLGDCARRPVETMSGGQRARFQILCLELAGANMLLLDEPTDNLDLATGEALEAALMAFTGTVLAVTHDRWFMRSFGRYLVFGDDCSVREALDLDTALHTVTGDPAYPFSAAALVPLGSG